MSTDEPGLKEVRANRFVLEDEDGNERAVLTVVNGAPELMLCARSEPRTAKDIFKPRQGLRLRHKNSKNLAVLLVDKGRVGLLMLDENGKTRVSLGVAENKQWLVLYDENGKNIWQAP